MLLTTDTLSTSLFGGGYFPLIFLENGESRTYKTVTVQEVGHWMFEYEFWNIFVLSLLFAFIFETHLIAFIITISLQEDK